MNNWLRGIPFLLSFGGLLCCSPNANSVPRATDQPADSAVMDPARQSLLQAYPGHLSHFEGNELVWKDGTRMTWDDGVERKGDDLLDHPDLKDMFGQEYPQHEVVFQSDFDPGRCRPDPFFMKIYGRDAAEVQSNLVPVDWFGQMVQFNQQNGAADSLKEVVADLSGQGQWMHFLTPSSGTFNWRKVAGTQRLSNHSFGIAIDIHVKHAHYWRWSPEFKTGKPLKHQNSIPKEIVQAFERHGFIWGGKWYHYDTMHFEFRPEQCRKCILQRS